MKFVVSKEGECYTPDGHDAAVVSHIIYKDIIDVHTTSFPSGAGMEEEVHEDKNHVFYVLQGDMEVLQDNVLLKVLHRGDAVYIPAGEFHEIRNTQAEEMVFLAITFKNA